MLPSHLAELTQTFQPAASNSGNSPTAVVIDTLRFTTTACRALEQGARSVQVASTVEQARQLASNLPPTPLLCGERHCHKIDGFDLGNSPFEYARELVQDRDLVFTTTNGTLAIGAVQHLPCITLAALVNRKAICQLLQTEPNGDVLIVCAGTDGQLTWEDVLTAGAIVDRLTTANKIVVGHDTARLAQAAWQATVNRIEDDRQLTTKLFMELSLSVGGRNLLSTGYQLDLQFASQLDTIDIVPRNSVSQPHVFIVAKVAKSSGH